MRRGGLWAIGIAGAASLGLSACAKADEQASAIQSANETEPVANQAVDNAANQSDAAGNAAAEPATSETATNATDAAVTPVAAPERSRKAAQPATAAPAAPSAAVAKAVAPPPAFAVCSTCHSTGEGDAHRIGPNLFGVVGSKAGSKPGYAYSEAVKSSGITWTHDQLEKYLLAPREMVPGTKMMVNGPKDEETRRKIVDYLATLK